MPTRRNTPKKQIQESEVSVVDEILEGTTPLIKPIMKPTQEIQSSSRWQWKTVIPIAIVLLTLASFAIPRQSAKIPIQSQADLQHAPIEHNLTGSTSQAAHPANDHIDTSATNVTEAPAHGPVVETKPPPPKPKVIPPYKYRLGNTLSYRRAHILIVCKAFIGTSFRAAVIYQYLRSSDLPKQLEISIYSSPGDQPDTDLNIVHRNSSFCELANPYQTSAASNSNTRLQVIDQSKGLVPIPQNIVSRLWKHGLSHYVLSSVIDSTIVNTYDTMLPLLQNGTWSAADWLLHAEAEPFVQYLQSKYPGLITAQYLEQVIMPVLQAKCGPNIAKISTASAAMILKYYLFTPEDHHDLSTIDPTSLDRLVSQMFEDITRSSDLPAYGPNDCSQDTHKDCRAYTVGGHQVDYIITDTKKAVFQELEYRNLGYTSISIVLTVY